jgi:hypothetical protein
VSDVVREFVANAHGQIDAAQATLAEDPTCANAAWDWGGGDWENGARRRRHMGRREIAELLLAHGARIDIFVAAMLGDLEVVKAMREAHPETREAIGHTASRCARTASRRPLCSRTSTLRRAARRATCARSRASRTPRGCHQP